MIAATIGYHLLRRPELALVVVNLAMEVLALEEPITRSPAGESGGAFSCQPDALNRRRAFSSPAREASSTKLN